jgi:hypothetical protein
MSMADCCGRADCLFAGKAERVGHRRLQRCESRLGNGPNTDPSPPAAVAACHRTIAAQDASSSFPTTCFVALISLDFDTNGGDRICVDHLADFLVGAIEGLLEASLWSIL